MTTSARVSLFEVAANPDPDSTLPFLIRLPLPTASSCSRPATAGRGPRRSTATAPSSWPRRARDRRTASRSAPASAVVSRSISCSTARARTAPSWCSPASKAAARGSSGRHRAPPAKPGPGSAFPAGCAAGLAELTILIDTRERYPYKFAQQQASTERQALPAGDYGIAHDGEIIAVVERKSLARPRPPRDRRAAHLRARRHGEPAARGRRGRGPLLQPVQARAHQARVRHRDARRAQCPLPDGADPLLRDPTARRRMDLPVPRRRARARPSHDPRVLTSHSARLVLTGPAATLSAHPLKRRREWPDQDETIPARAAQAARSNAAAESTAGPARTISRAPTSPTKPVTQPAGCDTSTTTSCANCSTTCSSSPSSTSR